MCVCVCAFACVRACVRAYVYVCVCNEREAHRRKKTQKTLEVEVIIIRMNN